MRNIIEIRMCFKHQVRFSEERIYKLEDRLIVKTNNPIDKEERSVKEKLKDEENTVRPVCGLSRWGREVKGCRAGWLCQLTGAGC